MANEKDIKSLAHFLAKVAKVEEDKDPQKTISLAVQAIKQKKIVDKEIMKKLQQQNLLEEVSEWVKRKTMGEPSTKCWAEINLGEIFKAKEQADAMASELEEDKEYNPKEDEDHRDNEYDDEFGIEYDDIEDFLDDMPAHEYVTAVYDPEELEDIEDMSDYEPIDFDDEDIEEWEEKARLAKNPEELVESLTMATRIKLRNAMRKNKAKIAQKRKIALKRRSTPEILKKRARKLAIKMMKKKWGKKDPSEMSMAEKQAIEKRLTSPAGKALIARLTRKMIPVVRHIEQARFAHKPQQ